MELEGFAAQIYRDDEGRVSFTDIARAHYRRKFASAGYRLDDYPLFEHFAEVLGRIAQASLQRRLREMAAGPDWDNLPEALRKLKR